MIAADPRIPKRYIDFCEAVAALARTHGFHSISGKIHPGFASRDWDAAVDYHWEQGRHGEDSGEVHIQSTQTIRHQIPPPRPVQV